MLTRAFTLERCVDGGGQLHIPLAHLANRRLYSGTANQWQSLYRTTTVTRLLSRANPSENIIEKYWLCRICISNGGRFLWTLLDYCVHCVRWTSIPIVERLAWCRYLKKLTCKGTLRQVHYLSEDPSLPMIPYPPKAPTPYTLYTVYLFTQKNIKSFCVSLLTSGFCAKNSCRESGSVSNTSPSTCTHITLLKIPHVYLALLKITSS